MGFDEYLDRVKTILKDNGMSEPIYANQQDFFSDEYFIVESGASKLVLIPKDKDIPYVFKIPFIGSSYVDGEDTDCNCNYHDSLCFHFIDGETDSESFDPPCAGCCYFYGSEQYDDCFESALVGLQRIDAEELEHDRANCSDYCFVEEVFYQRAEKEGLSDFFLPTDFCGYYKGTPIYKQARAHQVGCYGNSYYISEESKEAAKDFSNDLDCGNDVFLGLLIDKYGKEQVARFVDFCERYYINDLHSGNLGFIHDIPIIVDYSGFHD